MPWTKNALDILLDGMLAAQGRGEKFMGSGVEGNASNRLRRGSAPNGHVSSYAAQVKNTCGSVALVRRDGNSGTTVQEPSDDRRALRIKPRATLWLAGFESRLPDPRE